MTRGLIQIKSDGPMNSSWPMKCHDTKHTGRSLYNTSDNPYQEKWRFYSSGGIDDSPVIDHEGIIYFGGAYNYLNRFPYAFQQAHFSYL